MTEDEAVCSGSDRQVDTGMINSEGVDADNTFLCSDSGTIFMHEDAREDVEGCYETSIFISFLDYWQVTPIWSPYGDASLIRSFTYW